MQPNREPPRNSPESILAASQDEAKRKLEEGLELALEAETEDLLRRYPALKRGRPLMRQLFHSGFRLELRVPRLRSPSGEARFPPLFERLNRDPNKIAVLREEGVSTRSVSKVMEGLFGEPVGGSSRSNVSRKEKAEGEKEVREVEGRRFDGEDPVVVVAIDGTAVGTKNKKRTVIVVVGVTVSGKRKLLSTGIVEHERTSEIFPILRKVIQQGVSPNVFWISDNSPGIRGAARAAGGKDIGICTTHGARNARRGLPPELDQEIQMEIYAALAKDDPKEALAGLTDVEAKLRHLRYGKQANSLRANKKGMVVAQELKLSGELRKQLRSTNGLLEGPFRHLKDRLRSTTRWLSDDMRIRKVTKRMLEIERSSWKRIADAKGLVDLAERQGITGHDREAVLAALPPHLYAQRIRTPLKDEDLVAAGAEEVVPPGSGWLAKNPAATWLGAAEALTKLGVEAGTRVEPNQLADAMRGNNPATGTRVRRLATVDIAIRANGKPKEATVDGIRNLEWELSASPGFMDRWRAANDERRAELENAFADAATVAIARVTKSTQRGHGFASTVALHRPAPDAPARQSFLRLSGITVGVFHGSPQQPLYTPAPSDSLSALCRDAEDAAKLTLDRVLDRGSALRPDFAAHPREEPSAALLAAVEARALAKAARLVHASEGLAVTAASEAAAREGLAVACGETSAWWEANRESAAWQIASARLADQPRAKRDLWFPVSPGRQLLLGDQRLLELRSNAAQLLGRVRVNERLAAELKEYDADPLGNLGAAVERVESLAEAIAARRELERRKLFKAVAVWTPPGERPPPRTRILDRQGDPALRPVEVNRKALGHHVTAVRRYSAALAPQVRELSPAALQRLLVELGEPWRNLDQGKGFRQSHLEDEREAIITDLLDTAARAGKDLEIARQAEAKGEYGAAFESSGPIHEEHLERLRARLAGLAKEIDPQGKGTRPENERFLRANPEAAVYDAAFAELQQRELAQRSAEIRRGMGVSV